jgi:bacillithiol biosynthesis cysteine-adding enzyme BshC
MTRGSPRFLTEASARGTIKALVKKEGIPLRFEMYDHMKRHIIAANFMAGRDTVPERFDFSNPYEGRASVWMERASWLDQAARPSLSRAALFDVLMRYNKIHNDVPEAVAAIERLRDPETLAVVGGQQAGLFTGPMLVVYKAITIVQTARYASEALGRSVVPVFWIAGEDHDWDEANHTYILTPQLSIEKVAMPLPAEFSEKRTSVSRTTLAPEAWEAPLQRLAEAMPDTEFKPNLMEELQRIAKESGTLSDAFAKTMSLLFGKYGLVLIDSDDAALRAAEAPMFRELIRRQPELSDALKRGERAVIEAGYPLQAESAADSFNVFRFQQGERKLLFRRGADVTDRKGTVLLSFEGLEQATETEPSSFSNNALTRPLMQEFVLPTLATVLGPSEVAYWSTLKEAFHTFGQRTPVIVPRQEFTLLEGTVQKQMQKFSLSFEDVWERWLERRDDWLRSQDEHGLAAQFAQVKESFVDMYRPLIEAAASMNPGLRKLGETNMGKITEQIEFLQNKSIEAMKQQHEAGLRHWDRMKQTVQPMGKPQERVYNVFQYINRYGLNWLDEFIDRAAIDFNSGYRPHDVVYL